MTENKALEQLIEIIQKENDGKHLDFMIPPPLDKTLIGYQSIREDLSLCKKAITRLLNGSSDDVLSASLFYTFIALYGKCFTDATSSKSPKFDLKAFDSLNKHLIKTHNQIMDMRHNFIAHRGSSEHEFGFAYLRLNINDKSRQVSVKQLKRTSPKSEDLPKYIELLDYLIKLSVDKFQNVGEKVWKRMLNEYGPNVIAQLKIAGPTLSKNLIINK